MEQRSPLGSTHHQDRPLVPLSCHQGSRTPAGTPSNLSHSLIPRWEETSLIRKKCTLKPQVAQHTSQRDRCCRSVCQDCSGRSQGHISRSLDRARFFHWDNTGQRGMRNKLYGAHCWSSLQGRWCKLQFPTKKIKSKRVSKV